MADKEPDNPVHGLEEHLREMLRKANISFAMPQAAVPRAQAHAGGESKQDDSAEARLKPIREFNLKPHDVRDHLDRFVIRQDEAKKVLSVAICDHYNHVRRCLDNPKLQEEDYAKHNIILLGPTGVGKTYLMRCIAKLIKVPFVKADATKFSETGYVGHDVEDLVRDLVKAADNDVELAQYGIIYLDEVDKIAAQSTAGGRDVSGRGVQINLLKLMEETDVSLFSQTDLLGQMQAVMDLQRGKSQAKRTLNTRHILFIVSGAFDKLVDQVKHRVDTSQIGFTPEAGRERHESEYLRMAQTKDFIDYGFEPEFIGRLPIRVVCNPLSADDLEQIIQNSEGSILSQYRADFQGYGINLGVTPGAIKAIAAKAHAERTGARGLMTVLERVLRNYKFELPSTPIRSLEVNEKIVENPDADLSDLLRNGESFRREMMKEEVKLFADRFQVEQGMKLIFAKEAVEAIVAGAIAGNKTVRSFCDERFRDLEYGLKLISRNTGKGSFTITAKFVENPGEELSRRIAKSFKQPEDSRKNGAAE